MSRARGVTSVSLLNEAIAAHRQPLSASPPSDFVTRSLSLGPKFAFSATSRLCFATNPSALTKASHLRLTTSSLPLILTKATATTRRRDATKVLPPFPSHLLGNAVSPSLLSTLGLPLAAARISPIACSSSDSYICSDDDDPNDEFDLIVHKVLETIVEAVGTMIAFFVAGSVFFRHLNEFVSRPALSSLINMLCGIWEVCIAVRAAYLVDQNAKRRMDCHPKIADDGHADTLLLFILKMLLLFYSSSCLLKAGSPPCLVLVLIVLQYLILNQVSP